MLPFPNPTAPAAPRIPPSPPGNNPLRGLWRALSGNRLQQFTELQQLYGDIVRFNVGPILVYLINDPEMIKYIVQDNNKNYVKGMGLRRAKILLGDGLLTSEGAFWRRQRRLIQPTFHRQQLQAFAETMVACTLELRQRWDARAGRDLTFDVAGEMMRLTLDIVTRTLFGAHLPAAEAERVAQVFPPLLRVFEYRVVIPFDGVENLPLPIVRRYKGYIQQLDEIVYGIIQQRRAAGEQRQDLLGLLMAAQDEETGEQMTDDQVRDEVMTLFLAGHETTANALTWAWYLLGLHPAARAHLQTELDQVLAGRPPSAADLPRLVYTRWVIDEALRLYPPAWIISREPLADDVVGGYHVPAGATVIMSPYLVQRHPAYWDAPELFRPERFAPEAGANRPRFAYFPFGGGPRLCIGNHFALTEATLILATIAQRYHLEPLPTHPVIPQPALVLKPKHGVVVSLHRFP